MTNKTTWLGAALMIAGGMLAAQAAHASNLDFKFVNNTTMNITGIHLTEHSDSSWDASIPNSDTASGDSTDITFSNDGDGGDCFYDIKVDFTDGTSTTMYSLDLCTATKVAVSVDNDNNDVFEVTYLAGSH
jgi:hypothetical protein